MAALTATVGGGRGGAAAAASVRATPTTLFSKRPMQLKPKLNSDLGSLFSQFSGIRISCIPCSIPAPVTSSRPLKTLLRPEASRVCRFTGKKKNKANLVSWSNNKSRKWQYVNLQYKRVWWEAGKRFLKLRLSTKAIKTIEKNGLDAVAKKAGIDLSKE